MNDLQIQDWSRKTFGVKAVMVTTKNAEAVAAWCGGAVKNIGDVMIVQYFDNHSGGRAKLVSARVGDWITAEPTDEDGGGSKSSAFKIYRDDRFKAIFEQTWRPDLDKKRGLIALFEESLESQHLATLSGDRYGADDIQASIITRMMQTFRNSTMSDIQRRDMARTIARRTISSCDPSNPMAMARKIADAILEELDG